MKKLLLWAPRVLGILFTLFLMMFSLDVFELEASFWELVGGFLIHSIPAFILAAIVAIAWKRPIIGAVGFLLADGFYIIWMIIVAIQNDHPFGQALNWTWPLAGPAFLVVVLYYLSWVDSRKRLEFKEQS